MALKIIDGKVVSVTPPKNLTKKQLEEMEETPVNNKLIKSATSRIYNVVSKYTKDSSTYNLYTKIFSKVKLSDNITQSNRESLRKMEKCDRLL